MKPIKLYNKDMDFVAFLENATGKGYEKKLNDLWTASFSLPANDPKNKYCEPFNIIELFDGDTRVDLFRILPSTWTSEEEDLITYTCEHVLATLLDDILFQYHETDNIMTEEVLDYILGYQTTDKWQLGTVDFSYLYSYKWESENLLASLFSVPKVFIEKYQWTWDTTSFPWTLNLIAPDEAIKTYIRYSRNLNGIERDKDPTNLCTRLYGLGYGEGINQLTVSEVNGGLPYIEADTKDTYGTISRIFTDTSQENAETLLARMQAYLEELKVPRLVYSAGAAHIHQITKNSIDDFYLGSFAEVHDKKEGIPKFVARVVTISKPDIDGDPGNISIELANKSQDIASSISALANRQKINETYAQGATNIMANDYTDNCDSKHPAIIKFYIPEETVRINKLMLNYETSAFRAYSQATEGGGGSTATSESGGEAVESEWFSKKAHVDFSTTVLEDVNFIKNVSNHVHSFSDSDTDTVSIAGETDTVKISVSGDTGSSGGHRHGLYDFKLTTNIPGHTHPVKIPGHTHSIEHVIYEGATPSSLTVAVDGNEVEGLGTNESNVDLVPYLEKDAQGKIRRGQWHQVTITPNSLGRISANIITKLFIQSRGGGDY